MTQLEYFRLFAPEFAAMLDEDVTKWLTLASSIANVGCLVSPKLDMAIALYAAHLISLANSAAPGNSAAGALKREKEGDLEREYFQGSAIGTYGDSLYLLQFNELTLGCFGSAIMTRGPSFECFYPGY